MWVCEYIVGYQFCISCQKRFRNSQFLGDRVWRFVGLLLEISFAIVARKELEIGTF